MYIAVTPLIHSIRGKDNFTYQTSNAAVQLHVGQLVWIPWRSAIVLGVVQQAHNVKPYVKAKNINAVTTIILPQAYQAYIAWFAQFYAISLSYAYYLSIPHFTPRTFAASLKQHHSAYSTSIASKGLGTKLAQTFLLKYDNVFRCNSNYSSQNVNIPLKILRQ